MNLKHLSSISRFAVLGLALSLPAAAGIIVTVSADGPSGGISETGSSATSLGSAKKAHGSAYQPTGEGGSASVQPGLGLGPCFLGQVANVSAQSCAAVDMEAGILRAGASANDNFGSGAFGRIIIDDDVTFLTGTATFEIHLDLDMSASGTGDSGLTFEIQIATGNPDEPYICFYCVEISKAGWSISKPGPLFFLIPIVSTGQGNPTPIHDTISFPFAQPMSVRYFFTVGASCENEGSPCSAYADAQHTAYIGIPTPYTSSNGYSYLGFPTADVPEPAAAALSLAGLAALVARRLLRRG